MYFRKFFEKLFPINRDDLNAGARANWLEKTLKELPQNIRILDAGAGELANKKYCSHLAYVSQDFAQYEGVGNGVGLQTGSWDQTQIDIVSDITAIPEPDQSFDAILCSEVFEHLPDPLSAINEFYRLLKPEGFLILTAPFASFTHFAPYYYANGFSRFWYEHWLPKKGFIINELVPLGNYTALLLQETRRVPHISKQYCNYSLSFVELFTLYAMMRLLSKMYAKDKGSSEFACFGYNCVAQKKII